MVDGLVDTQKGTNNSANDPLEALIAIQDLKEKTMILLRDFHLFLQDPNPILIRQLKDVLQMAKTKSKTLIILGCRMVLPPELERELTVIEFALPGKEELRAVLGGIMESANIKTMEAEARDKVIDAASGLTTIEAENAFALSVVESKSIDPVIVAREKAQAVKKNGLLEIDRNQRNPGLDWRPGRAEGMAAEAPQCLQPESHRIRSANTQGTADHGIPGTGKSLTAKATAKVFGVPLLKLDAGRIFAGLVGQSESNLRSVIQTAEAIAPCCLWIDEMEKGFSGSKSSRCNRWRHISQGLWHASFRWMQEKKRLYSSSPQPMTYPNCRLKCCAKEVRRVVLRGPAQPSGTGGHLGNSNREIWSGLLRTSTSFNWPGRLKG